MSGLRFESKEHQYFFYYSNLTCLMLSPSDKKRFASSMNTKINQLTEDGKRCINSAYLICVSMDLMAEFLDIYEIATAQYRLASLELSDFPEKNQFCDQIQRLLAALNIECKKYLGLDNAEIRRFNEKLATDVFYSETCKAFGK